MTLHTSHRGTAVGLASAQERVVLRRALCQAGVPRWFLRNELRQRRWQVLGRQCVVLHNGPITREAKRWAAVLEIGRRAVLDGVTALQAAGLRGLSHELIHVSTPRGSTPSTMPGVKVHETRRYREDDVITGGLPRMKPAVAALHAALWARSDRQAKLFVTMTVQQQLATVTELREVLARVQRHRRRALLQRLLLDLAAGSQSLGELDVSAGLRGRGLPEPRRQSLRRRESGAEHLDCEFEEYDLVLEIDGAGHEEAAQKLDDLLRDLRLAAEGRTVIRIPLIAWALDEGAVLNTLEDVFRSRGWRNRAA